MLSSHDDPYWMIAENTKSKRQYYTPIRRLDTEDVWDINQRTPTFRSNIRSDRHCCLMSA